MKLVFVLSFCLVALTASHANSHHPQEFLQSIEGTKDEGRQVVSHFCASCHAVKPMIELGAPKINIKAEWDPRIKQGLSILLTHTEQGFNAMPARGGCFECSDKQLYLAILAMLPESLRGLVLKEIKDHK